MVQMRLNTCTMQKSICTDKAMTYVKSIKSILEERRLYGRNNFHEGFRD